MTQMRIRMRKLALKTREKIMTIPRKENKREDRWPEDAYIAADLDKRIEEELLNRLENGTYGDIYNYPITEFNNLLDKEDESKIEYVEGYGEHEEEDDIEDFVRGSAINESLKNNDDDEEMDTVDRKRMGRRPESAHGKLEKDEPSTKLNKKPRVPFEVEYEDSAKDRSQPFERFYRLGTFIIYLI